MSHQLRCVLDSQRKQFLKKLTMKTATGSASSCPAMGQVEPHGGQIEPHMERAINEKKNTL